MKTFLEKVEGFILEEYEDGTSVLLNPNSGIVHMFNTTSSLLYKLCENKIEKEALFDKFISKIDLSDDDISLKEIKSDFEDAIKDFEDRGILFFE